MLFMLVGIKRKLIGFSNSLINNNKVMKDIGIALIYVAFFSLIGFSLWVTKSVWVLLALIFTPEYHSKKD